MSAERGAPGSRRATVAATVAVRRDHTAVAREDLTPSGE
ncbi:hypothetical protein JOD57_001616 [Geodermatophilus bullaregiensis]|nr:hypothetical protein [Geodermatophilus bullaregiensis]